MFSVYSSAILLFILTYFPAMIIMRFTSGRGILTQQKFYSSLNDLTDGILLGVGFFHLLPEIYAHSSYAGQSPIYTLIIIILLVCFFAFLSSCYRRISLRITNDDCDRLCCGRLQKKVDRSLIVSVTGLLSIHSLSEGVALGFLNSNSLYWVFFSAIAIHKWLESLVVINAFSIFRQWISQLALILFSTLTPIGLILGAMGFAMFDFHTGGYTNWVEMFSCALFIYLGTSCLLSTRKQNQSSPYRLTIIGALLVLFIELISHEYGIHTH